MDMKELSSILQQNGIVGAGGAGFPTYAKLDQRAETIILNCAECEPLLRLHRQLLEKYAREIVDTFHLVGQALSLIHIYIKHMNSKKHEEFTGRGNELMLENAKKIAASGMTELSIRIPVIPGFNDTPEEIRDIAVFTRELGHVKRLHLLPYHRLGQDKYDGLNRPYLMGEVKPPANEKMQMLLKVAEEFSGVECQIGG